MSNEASVRSALTINKDTFQHRPSRTAFNMDVEGRMGPSPGGLTIPIGGVVVDLSQFVTPGLYEIANLEEEGGNYFTYGIYDPEQGRFYPWGECHPGQSFVGLFSRDLREEYVGTGTGTTAPTNKVFLKANGGTVAGYLGAFER